MELPELLRTQSHMDSSPRRKLGRYKENPDQLGRAIRKLCKIEMAEIEKKLDDSRNAARLAERDWFIDMDMLQELRNINERCSKYRNVLDTPVDKMGETKGQGSKRTKRHRRRNGRKTHGRKHRDRMGLHGKTYRFKPKKKTQGKKTQGKKLN